MYGMSLMTGKSLLMHLVIHVFQIKIYMYFHGVHETCNFKMSNILHMYVVNIMIDVSSSVHLQYYNTTYFAFVLKYFCCISLHCQII